jgi:iron complex outermembrane recepter protein
MNLRYTVVIALFTTSQLVYPAEITTLDDYTITARPIGLQSIEHIAQPITVLRDEELTDRQSTTIGETLSNIPGVTTNRFSPLASRPIIRGLGGSRVLVLENGVNSLDVSTISPDHAVTVEPIQTEQIEIFRGPSTLLYGSGASGGLVNAVTNRIPEYIPENLKTKFYSSYNSNSLEKLLSFQTEGGFGNIAFHLDGTKRDARNYQSKKGPVDNSFYDAKNFNFGSSYVDDWGFLGISFGKVKSRYGVPFDPDNPNELPFIVTDQDRFDIAGTFNNPFKGIQTINIQAGHNDYLHTEFEDAITAGTIFTNKQWDGRIEIQHSPIGKFNGTLGTQLGLRSLNAAGNEAYIPGTKSKTAAFFLLEETDFGPVHFEIGARYERQIDDPNNASKVTNDMYSASTGLHWHV